MCIRDRIKVQEMAVINTSKTPPFYIEDGIHVDENLRLRYRYLDPVSYTHLDVYKRQVLFN